MTASTPPLSPQPPQAPKVLGPWEKLDIIGKLLSTVLLGFLAFFIKTGTDNIATTQHEGQLVQSLLQDLTTKDQRTRQDLALIALNHAVGDRNPGLVADIAERLVLDTTAQSTGDPTSAQVLGGIAFHILAERDSVRAGTLKRTLQQQFENQVAADSGLRQALRSSADSARPSPVTGRPAPASELLARVSSRIVFIQYRGTVPESLVTHLRERFRTGGFAAPLPERIATPFTSSIRYFHPGDLELADSVASMISDYLIAAHVDHSVPVQEAPMTRLRAPEGQIEVWLSW